MRKHSAHDISKKPVVYQMPGMDRVKIRRDLEYRVTEAGGLTMDVYYPPDWQSGERLPAVLFVLGYSDLGVKRVLGCKANEMASYISWGRLTAASGMVAISYTNREPQSDIQALLEYIRQNAGAMGIDEDRIAIWACSGNVPLALSVLMQQTGGYLNYLKCAVLCYGFMLDLNGSATVSEASEKWGFVNACSGKSVDDLPRGVPLFVARAGQDQFPHLNETLDCFLANALRRNLPLTLANHAAAPHAFDLMHDSETTREIIRQILAFMRYHLRA